MNYQNSKIYKITDNTSNAVYIGSTCKTLQPEQNNKSRGNFGSTMF